MGPGAESQELELTVTGDITTAEGAVHTPTESLPDLGGGGQDPYQINARMFGPEDASAGETAAANTGGSESGGSTTPTGGGTEQTGAPTTPESNPAPGADAPVTPETAPTPGETANGGGEGTGEPTGEGGENAPTIPEAIRRSVRPGEQVFRLSSSTDEGVSVFDAGEVEPDEITPHLKGEVKTINSELVEKHGLTLEKTPGAENLPENLRENHWEIKPGDGMSRNQYKKALKALSEDV